ncbi:MAG: DUF2065 family protein [Candidatus Peregrinibacteria bacterium]|nr:DUF2065 family protein [Candidatus Peregrinibacteria bacterium]MDZ4244517.1 DUF2065 family protein [Candidatus Gracilibacteria bacterium]
MEAFLSSLIGPIYLVFGFSILFHHKSWMKLIKDFKSYHFGLFTLSFVMVTFGLLLVRTYNVWEWNPFVIITLTGWGMLLKGLFFFFAPGKWIQSVLKLAQAKYVRFGGLIHLALGVTLCYYGYFA